MLLPYFEHTTIQIGPLHIFVWGMFIAAAVGIFLMIARRAAPHWQKISYEKIVDVAVWMFVGIFLGARLAHVFFYEPAFFLAHPAEIFMLWHGGLASTGGIAGGVIAALLYFLKHKLPILAYGDFICACMPLAWAVGRFGCYVTHMHPGALVGQGAWLAVNYPDGARADLGLYESMVWIVIAAFVWLWQQKKHPQGFFIAGVAVMYGAARFALDFFRAHDVAMPDTRYAGLTPAQYAMLLLVGAGVFVYFKYVKISRT